MLFRSRPATRRKVAEIAVGMGDVCGDGGRVAEGERDDLIPGSCAVGAAAAAAAAALGDDLRGIQTTRKSNSNATKNLTSRSSTYNIHGAAHTPGTIATSTSTAATATATTTTTTIHPRCHRSGKPVAVLGKENVTPQFQVHSKWPCSSTMSTGIYSPVTARTECGVGAPGGRNEDIEGPTEDDDEEETKEEEEEEEYVFGDSVVFTSTPLFEEGGGGGGGGEGVRG